MAERWAPRSALCSVSGWFVILLRYDHWSPLWRMPDVSANRAVVTLEVAPHGEGTRVLFRHELPVVEAIAQHSDFFWRVGLQQLKTLMKS